MLGIFRYLSVIIWQCHVCASYRILLVMPFPSKSHAILGEAVVKRLLAKGHEITYITAFPIAHPPLKLTQLDISSSLGVRKMDHMAINKLLNQGMDYMTYPLDEYFHITRRALMHDHVRALLEDEGVEFDAVLAESMFSEVYSGFAAVYNCPQIWLTSTQPNWMDLQLMDEAPNPAYSAYAVSDGLGERGFWARWKELWVQWRVGLMRYMYSSKENNLYFQTFSEAVKKRGRSLPALEVMKYNASLMLGNTHASIGFSVKIPQSYKSVGGFHIDDKNLDMPEDLKRLLDESHNGIIYFSLGSLLETNGMSLRMKGALLQVFKNFRETVVWKVDEEPPTNMPGKVYMTRWAPQQNILAHPNTKVFITHGGMLSLLEAVHFAVPIVAIPVFGDQFLNVQCAVSKGFALRVPFTSDLHVGLKEAVLELLGNDSYKQKAKEVSSVYHHRVRKPASELIFWINHVIKTGDAPHLRSPALMLPWYQKYYLDLVILVLGTVCVGLHFWTNFGRRGKEVQFGRKRKLY